MYLDYTIVNPVAPTSLARNKCATPLKTVTDAVTMSSAIKCSQKKDDKGGEEEGEEEILKIRKISLKR